MITGTAYEEKDAGVLMRKKYRIRIYNFRTTIFGLNVRRNLVPISIRKVRLTRLR